MLILCAILIATASLTSVADGSAIKGHQRPLEELRSIKLPASNGLDKAPKAVAAPILESTKKIYNDESIRRSVALNSPVISNVEHQPIAPIAVKQPVVAVAEPVAVPKEASPVVPVAQAQKAYQEPVEVVRPVVAPVPVAAPVAPVVVPQVGAKPVQPIIAEQPVVVPVAQAPAVEVVKEAPIKEKSAPIVGAEVVAAKQGDELPPQSDRSAQIRSESPVVPEQPVVVVQKQVVEQPAVVKVVEQSQPEMVAVPAPAVAEPIVKPIIQDSPLQGKKDEIVAPAVAQSVLNVEPLPIEVPAPDPGLVLSEPIDSTTKLLIDLDEHVQKFLPAEDQQQAAAQPPKDPSLVAGIDYSPNAAAEPSGKSSIPLVPYSSSNADDAIIPPVPASLEGVEKASAGVQPAAGSGTVAAQSASNAQASSSSSPSATRQGGQHQNQQQVITQLLDQLDSLQNRIQDTINQLVARRRYVMSALLRPMGTYVRRVRTNLERLQNRVNQLQAAAVSVGGNQNRPGGGFVDAAAIETIRRRIDDISKRISDIVNRIRFSLTPTSAPLNSNGRK